MAQRQLTIMVVEDEEVLLEAITKKLKFSNIQVLSCASGQQGIDYLHNIAELPDAIWLDFYLKDMDGQAFLQSVRSNPKWRDIPVLVVSNSASPEKVNTMLALGADQYILKAEHRLDEIIETVKQLVRDKATRRPPAAGV